MDSLSVWLMSRREVLAALSVSSATLHRGMAEGRFPKPYRTGENSVRWKSDEIQAFIDRLEIAEPVPVAPGAKRGRQRKNLGGVS